VKTRRLLSIVDYYEEEDPGCCLLCEGAEEGCLCYDCKCTQCSNHREGEGEGESGYCVVAQEWEDESNEAYWRLRRNIQVTFKGDGWIEVTTTGPVAKQNYAKVKPFLLQHFRYNSEKKCYEVFTCNSRFVDLLFEVLRKADFVPTQIGALSLEHAGGPK